MLSWNFKQRIRALANVLKKVPGEIIVIEFSENHVRYDMQIGLDKKCANFQEKNAKQQNLGIFEEKYFD